MIRCVLLTLPLILCGCLNVEEEEESPPIPGISYTGVSLSMEANVPRGATEVIVAAAAYEDGKPAPLIGGDVLVARTEAEEKILHVYKYKDNYYSNTLTLNNPNTTIELEVAFDPQSTRAERWYPSDELLFDPGPGSIVGYKASITLPDEMQITAPLSDTVYTNRSDEFDIQWLGAPADQLRLVSRNICYSDIGSNTVDWVFSFNIDDDQSHRLSVGDLIPGKEVVETVGNVENFVTAFAQIVVNAFVEVFTLGLFEGETVSLNGFSFDYCTMEISLVRQQSGTLGEGVSGGTVTGSRSDRIVLEYRP